MEALCRHCGIVTRDLHRCEFCLTRMPEGVKLLKANSQFQSNLYVRFDCHTIQIGSYPNVVPVPLMGVNVTFTKKGISFTLPHWKTCKNDNYFIKIGSLFLFASQFIEIDIHVLIVCIA